MSKMTPSRKVSEILDLISEVESGNYYGETDVETMMFLFYGDVKIILGYRGDE
tara:strand:+ start:13080 stop:13238 length:159 start_codon:yes stop_codon:yes gene_type:complete